MVFYAHFNLEREKKYLLHFRRNCLAVVSIFFPKTANKIFLSISIKYGRSFSYQLFVVWNGFYRFSSCLQMEIHEVILLFGTFLMPKIIWNFCDAENKTHRAKKPLVFLTNKVIKFGRFRLFNDSAIFSEFNVWFKPLQLHRAGQPWNLNSAKSSSLARKLYEKEIVSNSNWKSLWWNFFRLSQAGKSI